MKKKILQIKVSPFQYDLLRKGCKDVYFPISESMRALVESLVMPATVVIARCDSDRPAMAFECLEISQAGWPNTICARQCFHAKLGAAAILKNKKGGNNEKRNTI